MALSKCNISCIKCVCALFCVVFFISWPELYAQSDSGISPDSLSWDFDEGGNGESSFSGILKEMYTPQIIADTKHIREYLLDKRFQTLRTKYGDVRTIDAIYLKSLKIAEHNIARALFLSLMAVLEHRKVDIKMPIFKSLKMPLTFEEDSIFSARLNHLPTHMYADTPKDTGGDRDKLQHFFGSAYLAYTSEAPEFTRTVGDLIEWGEAKFIVGGTDDIRDKRANYQGECFGHDLLVVKTMLPSDYLTFPHEDGK